MRRPSAPTGFTLVELVLVVVILGILVSLATPELVRISRGLRIERSVQTLVGDLSRARTDAIRRNATVAVTIEAPGRYRVEDLGARLLDDEVVFSDDSPDSVRFTAFGSTLAGREVYTLRLGTLEKRVVLDAAGGARVE